MGRCNNCSACKAYAEYKLQNKGKRNEKKVKRFDTANKCENPTSAKRKRRLTEEENLRSKGYGKRIRGEIESPIASSDHRTSRSSRPDRLSEDMFDPAAYEEYTKLVILCTRAADATTSQAVKNESSSILSKMRSVLDPKVRDEVDFVEASKDGSVILKQWVEGQAVGRKAFIPDLTDRDECFAAVRILSCAGEERKIIVNEFVDAFSEEGIPIYNELLNNIGERDKQCMPFVNMCLRAWMNRLSEDLDLWADLSLLDFDKWLAEEMDRRRAAGYKGKTSYELMMGAFGKADARTSGKSAQNMTAADGSLVREVFGCEIASTEIAGRKSTEVAEQKRKPQAVERTSRLEKLGEVFRGGLLQASKLRNKYRYNKRANAQVSNAILAAREGSLPPRAMRSCRDAARKMEDILFSAGGAERVVATLRYFKDRPAVREVAAARDELTSSRDSGAGKAEYLSKEERLNGAVIDGLRNFLSMFRRRRQGESRGGGRRQLEDQNAYDAVMAALNSGDLTSAKLGRLLSRTLDVSYRQVKRGRGLRREMEDMDTKHWVRKASAVPSNAIKEEHLAMICEFIHSEECSRIDNTDKVPAIVNLGICPDTGAKLYDLHERRHLLLDDSEILDELTGRNRADPANPNAPHPTWIAIKELTKTPSRPDGIKGSMKLVRKSKCPCMKRLKASVCSCDVCERAKDALSRYRKYQKEWRRQAVEKRKRDIIEAKRANNESDSDIAKYLAENEDIVLCKSCSGKCYAGSTYQSFSTSLSACMDALLCEKVHIPQLDLPVLNINLEEVPGETDRFKIHQERCCYGTHQGLTDETGARVAEHRKCGWDAVFCDMPMHERVETDESTGEEIMHRVRACPDEYGRPGKTIWMDFQKVARTAPAETLDDEDDEYGESNGIKFQTEWLPVEGTVPEFFSHLVASIEAYAEHIYEVKLSRRVKKCEERRLLIDPAVSSDCPSEYKNVVSEQVDFSSVIHAKRAHDLTCSIPEQHQCEVHHLTFDPKLVPVHQIEQDHPRSAKALRKKGVHRVLRAQNVVVYAFSKAKPSAAYNQQVTTNIISIVKEGKLPDDSKCEAFLDQKRIPGGDRTGFPNLPPGKLTEYVSLEPLFEHVRRWRRRRDGCAAQYQGKSAFRGWQTMGARHNIECEDCRNVAKHGKCNADGDTATVNGFVKRSFNDDYGNGTQNLVRHLAYKYPRPNVERSTRHHGERGLYAATMYIYMYIPEDGICENTVASDGGYRGSSRDHYYRSRGADVEVSRLVRRQRVCGCEPCLKLQRGCALIPGNADLLAAATPQALTVNIRPARAAPAARHTRNARNPLPEFSEGLEIGEDVIVRISNEEREDNPNEEYFVARIEERAIKLEASGTYSSVMYRKGDWIVSVCWYVFDKVNEAGDRLYHKGLTQYIPCNSIIRNISMPVNLDWTGRAYRLSSALDAHIEEFGDISY